MNTALTTRLNHDEATVGGAALRWIAWAAPMAVAAVMYRIAFPPADLTLRYGGPLALAAALALTFAAFRAAHHPRVTHAPRASRRDVAGVVSVVVALGAAIAGLVAFLALLASAALSR